MSHRATLFMLVLTALIVHAVPILSWPFSWLETFFHEISHGLAALLTGGHITQIELHWQGSGWCLTRGGMPLPIAFAGYAGTVAWGVLVYQLATEGNTRWLTPATSLLLALLATCLVFWARDLVTILILIVLLALFALPLKYQELTILRLLLRFSGLYVVMDAVRSPLHLIDGRNVGDGATLSRLTWLPELFWVMVWEAMALGGLYLLWRWSDPLRATKAPTRT